MLPSSTDDREPNNKITESTIRKTFTFNEDQTLKFLVKKFGELNSWKLIASRMGNRTPRQCRERWNNYLRPDIVNGPWTTEEEELLKDLYAKYGPNWTKMREQFPTRSNPNIKNHWAMINSHMKRAESFLKKLDIHEITVMINQQENLRHDNENQTDDIENNNNENEDPRILAGQSCEHVISNGHDCDHENSREDNANINIGINSGENRTQNKDREKKDPKKPYSIKNLLHDPTGALHQHKLEMMTCPRNENE